MSGSPPRSADALNVTCMRYILAYLFIIACLFAAVFLFVAALTR